MKIVTRRLTTVLWRILCWRKFLINRKEYLLQDSAELSLEDQKQISCLLELFERVQRNKKLGHMHAKKHGGESPVTERKNKLLLAYLLIQFCKQEPQGSREACSDDILYFPFFLQISSNSWSPNDILRKGLRKSTLAIILPSSLITYIYCTCNASNHDRSHIFTKGCLLWMFLM